LYTSWVAVFVPEVMRICDSNVAVVFSEKPTAVAVSVVPP